MSRWKPTKLAVTIQDMSHSANVRDARPTYRSVTVELPPEQQEALLMFNSEAVTAAALETEEAK